MKLRELLGELLEHLDEEVEQIILDVSFEYKVLENGEHDSKFICGASKEFFITHLLRLREASKQLENKEPTDELVKS